MFSLTHIYCAKKIVPDADALFLYGSIFPDISITGLIDWDEMRLKTEEFSKFIESKYVELNKFAEGLLLHEKPLGIDRFVHGENGYVFVQGRKIQNELEKHLHKDLILEVSHHFIEFAVEVKLDEQYPELQKELKSILETARMESNKFSEAFSSFFRTNLNSTQSSVNIFNNALDHYAPLRSNGIKLYANFIKHRRKTNLSEEKINDLLYLSTQTIEDNYNGFLNEIIDQCKQDLATSKSL